MGCTVLGKLADFEMPKSMALQTPSNLTLFYTCDLGIVVLHVMVPQPFRFPLRFLKLVW
jgi:hypothetical protein